MRQLLLPLLLALPAAAAELETADGVVDEPLTSIAAEGSQLVVRTPGRAVPLAEVQALRLRPAPPAQSGPAVLLHGGDVLRGALREGTKDALGVTGAAGALDVPLDLIRAVAPDLAPGAERALELGLPVDPDRSVVRLREGGSFEGSLEALDPTTVALKTDLGLLPIALEKAEVVVLVGERAPPPPDTALRAAVRLVDGSRVSGRVVDLDGARLLLDHPALGRLTIPLAAVVELRVLGGAFVYLSDLDPLGVEQHDPDGFTTGGWQWRRDANVEGGPLLLGGRRFEKGLGVHSYCALTFAVPARARSLRATLGLDDATRALGPPRVGAVTFRLVVDGRSVRELRVEKGAPAVVVAIDVAGAKAVTLVANYDPTTLNILGRADWADARFLVEP